MTNYQRLKKKSEWGRKKRRQTTQQNQVNQIGHSTLELSGGKRKKLTKSGLFVKIRLTFV